MTSFQPPSRKFLTPILLVGSLIIWVLLIISLLALTDKVSTEFVQNIISLIIGGVMTSFVKIVAIDQERSNQPPTIYGGSDSGLPKETKE